MNTHFKIIVPFYNVEKYIKQCLNSVKLQHYNNWQCIIIDDISTDNSVEIVEKVIKDDSKFVLISNAEKKFALANIDRGINYSDPLKEDVIVTLDGDDFLATPYALSTLDSLYSKPDLWITHGSYLTYPSGLHGKFSQFIAPQKFDNLRKLHWMSSHLRSFRYGLWDKIDKNDFVEPDGQFFYRVAWDLAFMFPMLEMAGPEHHQFVEDILYLYNEGNPLNDHKQNHNLQLQFEQEIRNKPKYERVEQL